MKSNLKRNWQKKLKSNKRLGKPTENRRKQTNSEALNAEAVAKYRAEVPLYPALCWAYGAVVDSMIELNVNAKDDGAATTAYHANYTYISILISYSELSGLYTYIQAMQEIDG